MLYAEKDAGLCDVSLHAEHGAVGVAPDEDEEDERFRDSCSVKITDAGDPSGNSDRKKTIVEQP